ncbi:TonB-dependent siderophore receptor [Metapseudomonas resinovorans]|uniref:Putative TonB-dependent receptor n=1 Tax=Metapseudomonas resinovorans NBRC 106553 TaxID=1245471 RepID=S6AYL8_METRE|nr:TonB-dependent siderophore receptor [Pseudomonas resinovorans]BAN49886.1 putative TonB-dependent receptor [Pseudomonas resinovorans NBRC 106553]
MANTSLPPYPLRFTTLLLCCSLNGVALAAEEPTEATGEGQDNGAMVLGSANVNAQRASPGALPPAFPGGQVARGGQLGVLGNQDYMDVPFSAASYTAKSIQDQQAKDIGEVLLNDASVRQSFGFGNQSQVFVIRGYPLNSDDISFNGLYGILPRQMLAIEAVERVEVFKGANAFINGVTASGTGIGGGVNIQPKRAEDDPTRSLTLDYTSDGQLGQHLDLGERFGEDNRFGARLNLLNREGDTAIDDEYQRTHMVSLALDYRGDNYRLFGDLGYQKQRVNQGRNMISLAGGLTHIPRAPSADSNWAQPWTFTELKDTFGMVRGEFDLNDDWMLYAAAGAKETDEVGTYSSPTLADEAGNTTGAISHIPHEESNQSMMAGVNGKLQTGEVSHRINIGIAALWQESRNAFDFGDGYTDNIFNPTPVPAPALGGFTGGNLSDPGVTSKTNNRSAAISDTLGFMDDTLLATIGLRRQALRVESYNYDGGSFAGFPLPGFDGNRATKSDQWITTPVYGVVYKLTPEVSLYANRMEGLSPGPIAPIDPTLVNSGQVFSPDRSKQYEAGVKLDMDTYGASFGVYRIEQPADGVRVGNVFTRDGDQVNKGVELNVYGEPVDGLRLIAGATYMDTELKSTETGANDGNRAVGVPEFQFNVGADWDIPGVPGAAVNARMLRTGGQYADPANNLSIPTWNRWDAGARYSFRAFEQQLTVRANVENISNKNYWASANGGYLTQGEPRTFKLSGTVDF